MRVVVHDFSGHPFQVQLSRALARRGHDVVHLYCGDLDGMKGALQPAASDPASFAVRPVKTNREFPRYSLHRRLLSEWRYGRALAREIRSFAPDAVISANTPLVSQALALHAAKRVGSRFTFWQQDVLSVAIAAGLRSRIGAAGKLIGRAFERLEASLLRRSDRIVVVSPDYVDFLKSWGLDTEKVRVIENWAPIDELPAHPKNNGWSRAAGLDERFVFLYAGTLGLKHDPSLLVALADRIPSAEVVVIAEGPGAAWLRDVEPRPNLRLMPGLPYDQLPEALATGDVLIALLEPDAGVFSVPSKVLSYMCAARPILGAIPAANLAHRLLQRVGCGVAVEPGDAEAFVAAASELYANESLRTSCARSASSYAKTAFDIDRIARDFEEAALGSTPAPSSVGDVLFAA